MKKVTSYITFVKSKEIKVFREFDIEPFKQNNFAELIKLAQSCFKNDRFLTNLSKIKVISKRQHFDIIESFGGFKGNESSAHIDDSFYLKMLAEYPLLDLSLSIKDITKVLSKNNLNASEILSLNSAYLPGDSYERQIAVVDFDNQHIDVYAGKVMPLNKNIFSQSFAEEYASRIKM